MISVTFVLCLVLATVGSSSVSPHTTAPDHLITVLKAMHHSNTFRQLPLQEQVYLTELLAAAEVDQIEHYIDTFGMVRLFSFLDDVNQINQNEAHLLEKYLVQRSLQSVIHTVTSNAAFQSLSHSDQHLMLDLFTAAEHHNVTTFINSVGYSSVISLVEPYFGRISSSRT